MLIKFINRGTGSGTGAVDYLTRKTDRQTGKLRQPAPVILRGSGKLTAKIIDSLRFKHKYRSGVLSFAPSDAPTEKQQQDLIDDFEAVAFAGIQEENRNILWVRHKHTGSNRVELHFLVPRVELSSQKSFNIAPPGWKSLYLPWQKKWNLREGWARPDDPSRARVSSPGHTAYKALTIKDNSPPADTRAKVTALVEASIQNGQTKDRTGVVKVLRDNGFKILREANKSITIANPHWDGNPKAARAKIRLKSQIFYQDWKLDNQLSPPLIETAAEIPKLESEIKEKIAYWREFNLDKYPQNPIVLESPPLIKFTSIDEMLVEALGDSAIVSKEARKKAIANQKLRDAEFEVFKNNSPVIAKQETSPPSNSTIKLILDSLPPNLKTQFAKPKKKKQTPKPKPKKLLDHHKYLESRHISANTIKSDRFSGQILIDQQNNVAFPYRDGTSITGYELINTNFKEFQPGCHKSLWQSNQNQHDYRLIIVESPLDALSFHQLQGHSNDRYIATGRNFSTEQSLLLKSEMMKIFERKQRTGQVIIATDNDEAGDLLAKKISDLVPKKYYWFEERIKPKYQNWNEDLLIRLNNTNNKRVGKSNQPRKSQGFELE